MNLDSAYIYPTYSQMAEMALFFGMFAIAFYLLMLFFALAIAVFQYVCMALTFKKAGEPWWKAIIPFYAEYTIGKLAKAPTSWFWGYVVSIASIFVVMFIGYIVVIIGAIAAEANGSFGLLIFGFILIMLSLVAIVPAYIYFGRILWEFSKSFGFDGAFGLGLLFLPYIFWAIMAFGKSEYQFKDEAPVQAPHIV